MITSKRFRFMIAKIYNILRYVTPHELRHICNLHIKETKIWHFHLLSFPRVLYRGQGSSDRKKCQQFSIAK